MRRAIEIQEGNMNIAVIYLTMTGHSKKIAEAIASETGTQAQDIKTDPKLNGVDMLFIVGGIYGGKSDAKLVNYIKNLNGNRVKKAVIVTSSGSGKTRQNKVREELTKNGVEVVADEYTCKGRFLFFDLKRPNQSDIDGAVAFAKKVVGDVKTD
jgi:flavodoxin